MAAELEVETRISRLAGICSRVCAMAKTRINRPDFMLAAIAEGVATAQQVQGKGFPTTISMIPMQLLSLCLNLTLPTARPVPSSNTPIRVAWHAVPICQKRSPKPWRAIRFQLWRHYCHEPPAGCDHRQSDYRTVYRSNYRAGADDAARDISRPRKICGC